MLSGKLMCAVKGGLYITCTGLMLLEGRCVDVCVEGDWSGWGGRRGGIMEKMHCLSLLLNKKTF